MKPQIRIFKNLENLSQDAARIFIELADQSMDERGRFLVALNGGGTPKRLFQLLATDYRERVDWDRTHVFWGDERLVPTSDPENSYAQARDLFLRHVQIPEENVHRVQTELDPTEAAKAYTDTLQKFADPFLGMVRFDLIYLGMGEDGHTASLFPGSSLNLTEPVIPVTGNYQGRPAQRITLTPIVINNARTVAFMTTGDKKAETLAHVLSGRYQPELYPAQRIEPKDGKLIWLVDEDAASKLPMELVRRFCEG
jgi:6-phosphogluconolactonase